TRSLHSTCIIFFFSSRRRHTRWPRDWSSDVCSSDLPTNPAKDRGRLESWHRSARRSPGWLGGDTRSIRSMSSARERRTDRAASEIGRASCRESVDLCGRRIIKEKEEESVEG